MPKAIHASLDLADKRMGRVTAQSGKGQAGEG
jgi:hypothetical protein